VLSFVPAVTVTWYCNRRWVFARTNDATREYSAYFGVQVLGAAINFGTYALLIAIVPPLTRLPVAPLAAGSALALLFNYSAARRWVFSEHR
jgi:putative flippase GtrA